MSDALQVSAVIHTLSSSRFFDDCLKSVKCQTLRAAHIIVVCDTVPFPKAQQQGLEQVTTPFFVAVDDDMIMFQDCFEKLLASISQNEQCADMAYRLRDPILGNVVGIHFYRTEPVKRIGFWQSHRSWLIVYAWAGLFAGITGETTAAPLDADRLRKHNLLPLLQKRLPIIEASERPTSKASTSCRIH